MDTEKLKRLLTRHGMSQTQLAALLGRDKSAITLLLQGKRQLKAEEAALIARTLGVPVAEVLGMKEEARGVEEAGLIPFQHAPKHSKSSRQVVHKSGRYFLEDAGAFSPKAYAMEVRDDSMNLAGILPGDVVISELDRPAKKGDTVVVQHYAKGGAETLVRRYEPPFVMCHSTNGAHRPLHVEKDDVRIVSPVLKLVRLW